MTKFFLFSFLLLLSILPGSNSQAQVDGVCYITNVYTDFHDYGVCRGVSYTTYYQCDAIDGGGSYYCYEFDPYDETLGCPSRYVCYPGTKRVY